MSIGEVTEKLVKPDPRKVWSVYIETKEHNPYFAIRGDGQVFLKGNPIDTFPPYDEVFIDGDPMLPTLMPEDKAKGMKAFVGMYVNYQKRR